MGMICGIGTMSGWQYMMRYRSNKRIAKAVDVQLMGCLNRDDLKKICGDKFPEWISFPVFEQGWAQQPSLEEFENLLSSQELLAKQLAGGSISPGKKEECFNNYSRKPLKCYRCGKTGHIRRYCRAKESNMAQTKVVKEEEWGKCLAAESRAIDAFASINLERDWIESNTIYHVEHEGTNKKQEDTEDIQTGDVVDAIEEIKEEDPKIGHKSLNVKDVEVDFEETVSENQYANDDFIGESIKGNEVEVEVSDQSPIVSRSITGSEQILKVYEEAKDSMNDGVEIKAPVSDGETYNMIERLETKSNGGFCYNTEASQKINDQIIIKSIEETNTDETSLCYGSVLELQTFPSHVKWLNKQLSKLWPFVADAGEAIIKDSVEPILEDYRPPGISSMKFSKLSLGTVAPKIEGIRVQSLKKGQIIMDIDLRWGGDPNIVIEVDALVASIPIQLKDLQVFTVIRVIFQLAEEIPCISAVVVALLSEPKPRIDYTLKAVGGSLTALPGLSDMIEDTVDSIVTDMLEWPHRIVVPIGGLPVDTSDLELKPQGKLTVTVMRATNLKNQEMIGKSDPYVVLYIRPLFKFKTKTIDNNLNPVWDETFELIAEDKETQSLLLEVFDEDIGEDDRMGVTKLPLNELESDTPKEIELRLLPKYDMLKVKDKKDRGTITIKILYHEFNKKEQLAALEEEKRIMEERKQLKAEGVIGSSMEALDGAAALAASRAGVAGSGIGSGLGAGVRVVRSGLSKTKKFMGRTFTGQSSNHKKIDPPPVNVVQD
ncbi:putative digalactosyldiacylglycerol synthase 2, chloroplastic-like [Capsicum annuum]|nr:putative digalactosyldiacylglycerol synthase 2, chloroplastic-like [Capsicum annuum]